MLVCLLALALPADAQEDDDFESEFEFLEDEEIVFTAAKHKQDIAESPSAITVISREQIANTYCTDVICLLRQVPEVDVLRIKPVYPSVGARALTDEVGEKVLLLVDGRELNNEIFGIPFWQAGPVHLEDIERIEVIRGPGSALYGANAHSMVVSVFTRKSVYKSADVFLGSGERNRSSLHLRAGHAFGKYRLRLSGGLETANHWQIWSLKEREIGRLRLHLDHQTDTATVDAQIGLVYGDGPIYSALGPAEMQDMLAGDLAVSYHSDFFSGQLNFTIMDAAIFIEVYQVHFEGIKLGEVPDTIPFISTDLDGQAQFDWSPFEGNLLIAGANLRWISAFSDNVDPGNLHQLRIGLFLHDEQRLGDSLLLTGGIRFDYNNITPFTVSPRLAGVWEFTEEQFLRLAGGQAFRKPSFFNSSIHMTNVRPEPSFETLADFFKTAVGNENLENEAITSFELGYRGRFLDARMTVEADVFYNRYRDTINLHVDIAKDSWGLPDLANSTACYQNKGREADSLGGSVSITGRLVSGLRLSANYTYRYSWYTSEPGGTAAPGEGEKGDRVRWEPAHLANLSVAYLPESGLRMGLGWHGSSPNEGYVMTPGSTFDVRRLVPMPANWFLSGFLSWRVDFSDRWLELGIRAFNLLHTPFREIPASTTKPWTRDYRLAAECIGRRFFFFLRGSI